jgi:hypothetical protein
LRVGLTRYIELRHALEEKDAAGRGSLIVAAHRPGAIVDMIRQYARQESNSPAVSAGKLHVANLGGAQSGALSEGSLSPAVTLLLKLSASLTPNERMVLSQLLCSVSDQTGTI